MIYNHDEQKGDVKKSTPDAPIICQNKNTTAIMRPEEFILLTEEGDFAETLNSYQDSIRKVGVTPNN